jgi:hypothetical protein
LALAVPFGGACSRAPTKPEEPADATAALSASPVELPPTTPPVAPPPGVEPSPPRVDETDSGTKPCPGARTPRAGSFPYRGRVLQKMTATFGSGFKPDAKMQKLLEADGRARIDDKLGALVYAPQPAHGWVKVGREAFMLDPRGAFVVPDMPANQGQIEVWESIVSGPKLAVFPLDRCGFEAKGDGDAATYTIKMDVPLPPAPMN